MRKQSSIYDIANDFAELTSRSIFITGNAGTGKTTFLKKLRETTQKQIAVVAPTGIAAINAGGATMHSFFQLPFTPFVPTPEGRKNLISKMQMSSIKRRVIQELDVLVIDEISMVRADVLDEVDTVMRHVRYRHNEPFGGAQVIYIGDLYQLPPVVINEEWQVLAPYYDGPFFFQSKVVQEQPPTYIELDKIFRQNDSHFIQLLNEVRHNRVSPESMEMLEDRFDPDAKINKDNDYILLTTHNARADAVNSEQMAKIKKPMHEFQAKIVGEFPEKNYPNDFVLELKEGAKVMFIANDMAHRYFNGKLGTISYIDEDEKIFVRCDGEDEDIEVAYETWENVRYSVNPQNRQIEEKKMGSYTQYPLRLAWAITIHKSQGLTFDKVMIDAESAFSSGQVYVALSRCRTLDGIILCSHIFRDSLMVNPNVVRYSNEKESTDILKDKLSLAEAEYNKTAILKVYSFKLAMAHVQEILDVLKEGDEAFNPEAKDEIQALQQEIQDLDVVADKFQRQLQVMWTGKKSDMKQVEQRIAAADSYFSTQIDGLLDKILNLNVKTDNRTAAKNYQDVTGVLYTELAREKYLINGINKNYTLKHLNKLKQAFVAPSVKINILVSLTAKKKDMGKYPDLYRELNELRHVLADSEDMPAYRIFPNTTLIEMATKLPTNSKELLKIKGVGQKKMATYGKMFVDVIIEYVNKQNHSSQQLIND